MLFVVQTCNKNIVSLYTSCVSVDPGYHILSHEHDMNTPL